MKYIKKYLEQVSEISSNIDQNKIMVEFFLLE